MAAPTIRRASLQDMPPILALLEAAHLPAGGLAECIDTGFVATDGAGDVVAAAALELHGDFALLRSVVAREDVRGSAQGSAVVAAAIELARELGLRGVYLFTMNAPGFFARFGFVEASHRLWPEPMRAAGQWAAVDAWDDTHRRPFAMALAPLAAAS